MNIDKYIYESGLIANGCWDNFDDYAQEALNKFAELIVWDCIKQAHSVANLRGVNDQMIYGADSAAVLISKHFGIK